MLSWTGFKNVGNLRQELCWPLRLAAGPLLRLRCASAHPSRLWGLLARAGGKSLPLPPHLTEYLTPCPRGGWTPNGFSVQNKISWEATTNGQRKERHGVPGPCHPRGTPLCGWAAGSGVHTPHLISCSRSVGIAGARGGCLGGCPCRWPCPGLRPGGEAAARTRSRGSACRFAPPSVLRVLQHVVCAFDKSLHLFPPPTWGAQPASPRPCPNESARDSQCVFGTGLEIPGLRSTSSQPVKIKKKK